jgi:chromosome segregation ATPase
MEKFNDVIAGPPSIQGLENKINQLESDVTEQQRQNAALRKEIAELKRTVEKQDKEKGKNLALHYQLEKSRFDLVNMMNEYNSLVESKVTTEADFNTRLRDVESNRAKIEKSLKADIESERKEKKVILSHLKESQRVIQKKNATIQKLEQRLLSLEGSSHPMSSSTECDLVDEIERLMEENIHKSTQIENLEKTTTTTTTTGNTN